MIFLSKIWRAYFVSFGEGRGGGGGGGGGAYFRDLTVI